MIALSRLMKLALGRLRSASAARPPSSGKAGIRLKADKSRLIPADSSPVDPNRAAIQA